MSAVTATLPTAEAKPRCSHVFPLQQSALLSSSKTLIKQVALLGIWGSSLCSWVVHKHLTYQRGPWPTWDVIHLCLSPSPFLWSLGWLEKFWFVNCLLTIRARRDPRKAGPSRWVGGMFKKQGNLYTSLSGLSKRSTSPHPPRRSLKV